MKHALFLFAVSLSPPLYSQQSAVEKMEALDLTTYDKSEHLLYRQYKPANVEEGKTYPLVIFLHGRGECGDDNKAQLKHCIDDILGFVEKKNNPVFSSRLSVRKGCVGFAMRGL